MKAVDYLIKGEKWGGIYWDIQLEKRFEDRRYLEQFGYKIYSQNDEDGIIHEIFKRINVESGMFVEFGVSNGLECNTHSLLLQGWKGLWIEGNKVKYKQIHNLFSPVIQNRQLTVFNAMVFDWNINEIIKRYTKTNCIDLLSIDIDGNDWHIWKAIECIKPRVVVIEYNAKYPPEIEWVMPYSDEHVWDGSDMFGASLKALEKLGREKGYCLVGTNVCGVNAFFVKNELAEDKFANPSTAENLYNPARYGLKLISGHPAKKFIGLSGD